MQGATAFGQLDTAKQLTCRLQMAAPVGFFGFSVSFASSHSCTVSIFAKNRKVKELIPFSRMLVV